MAKSLENQILAEVGLMTIPQKFKFEELDPTLKPLTDTGNAELLTELFGEKIRFDHRRKRWLIWEGHRWKPDNDGEISRLAIEAARERARKAVDLEYEQRRSESKWALQSETKIKLDATIAIAKNLHPIADAGDNWDQDSMLLGCSNGVIDLKTGEFRKGRLDDHITMSTGTKFDPAATCPRWEQFTNEVFDLDIELISFVKMALGYSITGSTREQSAFFCYGSGANGKSVLFKTISSVLGDYAYDAPASLLQRNAQTTSSNDVASTEFKRFLVSSETLSTSKLNEQRLKAWTGGDKVTARFLFSEFFSFEPTVKPWLFINHKPLIEDDSHGFWRRVKLIPFNRIFKPEEQDHELLSKLREEKSGILNWLVEGCLQWQKTGLSQIPVCVRDATRLYQAENDALVEFIYEKCDLQDSAETKARDLFTCYTKWASESGLQTKDILTNNAFGRRMGDKLKKVTRESGTFYQGICLKKQEKGGSTGGF